MAENARSHLQGIVDALTAAGNSARPPGFYPTQGGWVCEMTGPLDPDVATACVDVDPRLAYRDDELSCVHCWSAIIGREAQTGYGDANRNARRR